MGRQNDLTIIRGVNNLPVSASQIRPDQRWAGCLRSLWGYGVAMLLFAGTLGQSCGGPGPSLPVAEDDNPQVLDFQPTVPAGPSEDPTTTGPQGGTEVNPPQLSIQASITQGAIPLEVAFSAATLDGSALPAGQYSWDFGDGTVGSGQQVAHTYTRAAVYTVSLALTVTVIDTPVTVLTQTYITVAEPPAANQLMGLAAEYELVQDEPFQFALAASASDSNTRYVIVSGPSTGTLDTPTGVSLESPVVTYTPPQGYEGQATFQFVAYDSTTVTAQAVLGSQYATVKLNVLKKGVLFVSPVGDLNATGAPGGPFSPAGATYTLTNAGSWSLHWTASKTQPWVTLSPAAGTLEAGASTTITVSLTSAANSLAVGDYSDAVTFLNTTNSIGNATRAVNLAVATTPGQLSVTPAGGLNSSGIQGGPFSPSSLTQTLTNTGGEAISWTASKTQSWVTLSKVSGTLAAGASDSVTIAVNSGANNLAAGGYNDTITFTNTTNGSGNVAKSVSLTVTPTPGALSVTASGGLSSSGYQGGPFSPSSITYTVRNTGGQSINWTSACLKSWVTLSKTSGTLAAGAADTVTVSLNNWANNLPAGSYSDTVSFANSTNAAGNTSRSVSLAVAAPPGTLSVTPLTGLTSSGVQGGPFSPWSTIYTLTNTGGQPINWTAAKTQSWVSLSKTSGTLAVGATDTVTVTITSGANSLAAGDHSDTVAFTNTTDGSGNAARAVNLTVSSNPGVLSVTPAGGLASTGAPGGPFSPASLAYTLTNTGGESINWTAAKAQSWVTLSKTSGTLAAGATDTVTVAIGSGANSLAAGSYSDTVTFTNNTSGAGDMTRTVTLGVANQDASLPMTTASRTSGAAPLAVFFDTTTSSCGVVQPTAATGDVLNYNAQTYAWDFGDPGSGSWTTGRTTGGVHASRNAATGYTTAHVYETPGTYIVTLSVTDESATVRTYTQTITVTDFTGTTYYLSAEGSDSNNGTSSSTPVKTLSKAVSLLGANKRLLIRRGDSFTLGATINLPNGGRVGAYGTGANPVLNATSGSAEAVFGLYNVSDVVVQDITMLGPPTASTMAFSAWKCTRMLALRVSIESGWGLGALYGNQLFVVDSVSTGSLWGSLFANANYLAVLGNHFNQTLQGDGHNLYIDAVNRGVFVANTVAKPIAQKHCLRIAANERTSYSVTITDNEFDATTTWLGVQFGISSGSWDTSQHAENILFERNTVRTIGGLPLQMKCDYRNTMIRHNELLSSSSPALALEGFGAGVTAGYDGPRGVWVHDNTITVTGSPQYWWKDNSAESQNVYVYQNTVNGTSQPGTPPPSGG